MQVNHTCPLCNSTLELKQINLTSAIFICTKLKCPYPVNQDDCILIKRRLRDINKPFSVLKREFEMKHNKTKVIQQPNSVSSIESSVESSPSTLSDIDLPMQEIDDLLNSLETFHPKPGKPNRSQDLKTEDVTDLNLDLIQTDVSTEPQQNRQLKTENMHGFGDELNIVPMSESQYQDMDNFLMDLLK